MSPSCGGPGIALDVKSGKCCCRYQQRSPLTGVLAGEDLDVGTARSNYLAYEARLVGSPGGTRQGTLVLFWPGAPGQGTGTSCSNMSWPVLDRVMVLGGGPVDTGSITFMVHSCPLLLCEACITFPAECMSLSSLLQKDEADIACM